MAEVIPLLARRECWCSGQPQEGHESPDGRIHQPCPLPKDCVSLSDAKLPRKKNGILELKASFEVNDTFFSQAGPDSSLDFGVKVQQK